LYVLVPERNDIDLKPAFWSDNITSAAIKKIDEVIIPHLQRDEDCNLPKVQVLDSRNVARLVNEPATLTVTVKVNVDTQFLKQGHKGIVLTLHLFRPEARSSNYTAQVLQSDVMPISLGWNDDEIKKSIRRLFDRSQLMLVLSGKRDAR